MLTDLAAALPLAVIPLAHASEADVASARDPVATVTVVTPIFGQLLVLSYPEGFQGAFSSATGSVYLQESVPVGETVDHWSQMITVTGARGLASDSHLTPQNFVQRMAAGFKKSCPDSFSTAALSDARIEGVETFGAVLSCGTAPATESSHSETALVIAIKGKQDYYTIQWAERGQVSASPMTVDAALWSARFKQLSPIRLCPIVAGEQAPYVSCVGKAPARSE